MTSRETHRVWVLILVRLVMVWTVVEWKRVAARTRAARVKAAREVKVIRQSQPMKPL